MGWYSEFYWWSCCACSGTRRSPYFGNQHSPLRSTPAKCCCTSWIRRRTTWYRRWIPRRWLWTICWTASQARSDRYAWENCLYLLGIVRIRTIHTYIYIYIENNQKIYIYWGLNMCPVMRGFEEIGCFFYKGLLKGLGWGRENWRSENFEVTSQVLFFHFAIKHGWNIHSVQWFSLSNSMEKTLRFSQKATFTAKKTMCGCYMSLLSPFSINHYYMKTIGCL